MQNNKKKYADGGPITKPDISQVTVFQPGTRPAIYSKADKKIDNIEAGLNGNQPKVVIRMKNGEVIMAIGLPFIVFIDSPKNEK